MDRKRSHHSSNPATCGRHNLPFTAVKIVTFVHMYILKENVHLKKGILCGCYISIYETQNAMASESMSNFSYFSCA